MSFSSMEILSTSLQSLNFPTLLVTSSRLNLTTAKFVTSIPNQNRGSKSMMPRPWLSAMSRPPECWHLLQLGSVRTVIIIDISINVFNSYITGAKDVRLEVSLSSETGHCKTSIGQRDYIYGSSHHIPGSKLGSCNGFKLDGKIKVTFGYQSSDTVCIDRFVFHQVRYAPISHTC